MLKRWVMGEAVRREWVPLEQIAPSLPRAVIASEDQLFCAHWGVDFDVLREILSDPDGPDRGGSTISMQTVKNVFLWHGRSYVRKAIEIPLALSADLAWGKKRMIEIYLNVAEWGDGIFGPRRPRSSISRRAQPRLRPRKLRASRPLAETREARLSRPTRASQRVLRRMAGVEPYLGCLR